MKTNEFEKLLLQEDRSPLIRKAFEYLLKEWPGYSDKVLTPENI